MINESLSGLSQHPPHFMSVRSVWREKHGGAAKKAQVAPVQQAPVAPVQQAPVAPETTDSDLLVRERL